ncbi:hypothetical protein CTEN210_12810 [Chaetoceros tenuissimus]|uniref:Uncharacterized protein n=1 Tax=Chaetoceros tenuissimus TaxID=426638 RepID=A0AAD3D259_9STRA|nr:hypothetical protein CTEN210_12810 [Chaetoceros tenuissimus]
MFAALLLKPNHTSISSYKKNDNHKLGSKQISQSSNDDGSTKTFLWWCSLSLIAVVNIFLWLWTYFKVTSSNNDTFDSNTADPDYQRMQLILSGIYVLVCAYRSVFPRIDLERYCLFDTPLSSIFLGRLSATIAEISYSAQFALFLYKLGEAHHHPMCQKFAMTLVPLITVAQMFCWCGVLSLNHVYHAIEESIWALVGGCISVHFLLFSIHHSEQEDLKLFGLTGCILSTLFFLFMVIVDVPMYIFRWKEGKHTGREHMLMKHGSVDAFTRRVVTWEWNVWKEEVMWLTGYFSSAVWISFALVHMPIP